MLDFTDFRWVPVPGANTGYYSLKTKYYEVCIFTHNEIRTVVLSTRDEEVILEETAKTDAESLIIGNKFYQYIKNGVAKTFY